MYVYRKNVENHICQMVLSIKKNSFIKGKVFTRGNPIPDRLLGKVSLIM